MSDKTRRNGKALSLLIVWTVALGGLVAAVLALSPPVRAGPCDQVGGVITGDWTITTAQTCSGIVYTVDGTININAGGSLTLIDGGLSFAKDTAHSAYALNVNAGGALILDNSIVTTQTNAIDPYLWLPLTVSGANSALTMRNGAILKFPGWFNATGATIDITGSTITGFVDAELSSLGVDMDDTNDAPIMSWSSTTASLYGSRIERIFEYVSGNSSRSHNLTLTASSNLYAYDTFIGVDYSDLGDRHNEVQVDGTSNAYLYGVTIDRTQDPGSLSAWQPAYRPTAAGGSVYLLRWALVTALDSTGFPVGGASIASSLSPSATSAQYPDNGMSTTPTARTLAYLGRDATGPNAWYITSPSGFARIPLYTDQITVASLPNGESFGNYQETATFSTFTTTGGVFFPPYPSISGTDNSKAVVLRFSGLQVRTGPDLEVRQSDYPGTMTVIQNQAFSIYALIYNAGQTNATNAEIAVYLNGDLGNEVGRASGLTIVSFLNQTVNVAGIPVTGPATLMLFADPDGLIDEGGAGQEANNFANITLNVIPPPEGTVALLAPSAGQTVEPGTPLSVSGFVRDFNANGISGVPLTIELRTGGTVVAQTSTVSGSAGAFLGQIDVPSNIQEGTYSVVVTPTAGSIAAESRVITIQRSQSILTRPVPILGIPYWLLFVIIAAAVAGGIGITLYWKVYGLGKMVECGECGAFIPEDATTCPKCGVEFEKDMAKCSNCQAWIPVDVKQCPECGVEFATGELEMADYQEKMRLQYDEVVQKFKQEASRQLGRTLSDTEFKEWWRKQPTFLTFEDWLREEEEMRKMGSKPCPTCSTLNSVTAIVCHKCGSLMRETARPPMGGSGGGGAIVAAAPRKPVAPTTGPPVVQKRVIKKPIEDREGEGSSGESNSSGENSGDEL